MRLTYTTDDGSSPDARCHDIHDVTFCSGLGTEPAVGTNRGRDTRGSRSPKYKLVRTRKNGLPFDSRLVKHIGTNMRADAYVLRRREPVHLSGMHARMLACVSRRLCTYTTCPPQGLSGDDPATARTCVCSGHSRTRSSSLSLSEHGFRQLLPDKRE